MKNIPAWRTCWCICGPATCTSPLTREKTRSPAARWPMPWPPAARWSARLTCMPKKCWPRARLLVPFGDSQAMAEATVRFLSDTVFQVERQRCAYQVVRPMFWPNVGRQERNHHPGGRRKRTQPALPLWQAHAGAGRPSHTPVNSPGRQLMHAAEEIPLTHLDRMTDSTGLIQHAIFPAFPAARAVTRPTTTPRALRLCTHLWEKYSRTSACSTG